MAQELNKWIPAAIPVALIAAVAVFAASDWPRFSSAVQKLTAEDAPAPLYFQFARDCESGRVSGSVCEDAISGIFAESSPDQKVSCDMEAYWAASEAKLESDTALADKDWRQGVREVLGSSSLCTVENPAS